MSAGLLLVDCWFTQGFWNYEADAAIYWLRFHKAPRNSVGVTPATRRKTCAKALGLV